MNAKGYSRSLLGLGAMIVGFNAVGVAAFADSGLALQPLLTSSSGGVSSGELAGTGVNLVWERPSRQFADGWKLWLGYQPANLSQVVEVKESTLTYVDNIERTVMALGGAFKFSFSDQLYLSAGLAARNITFSHTNTISGANTQSNVLETSYTSVGLNAALETDVVFSNKIYLGIEWFGIYTPIYTENGEIDFKSSGKFSDEDLAEHQSKYSGVTFSTQFVMISPRVGYVF